MSPRPATRNRAPGNASSTAGIAPVSTGRPLRGSSSRPRNAIVGACGVPVHRGSGRASAKVSTYTPFGITTASPPRCSTRVRRASSETAIRAEIFSRLGRTIGWATCSARERSNAVWNVATIGPDAIHSASMPRLGVTGSCRCRMSKSPAASQRRTRRALTGPKVIRATEPLYRTGTARPAGTRYSGTGVSSSAGASTDTSWPWRCSASARSRTWNCTPPGTSNEYGHTMPIFIARRPPHRPRPDGPGRDR